MADNDSLITAIDLGILDNLLTLTDFVGTSDRNDYYRFELSQNSQVSLNLTGMTQAGQVSIVVDLNNNGAVDYNEEIEFDNVGDFSGSAADRFILRTLPKGIYWVRVYTAYDDQNTNYTLTASAIAIPPTSPIDPGEFNTSINLGNLSATQTFTDAVGALDRSDFYKFTLEQNSQVNLSLTGLTDAAQLSIATDLNNNGLLDYNEEIELDGVGYYFNITDDRSIIHTLPKGTYWVRVYSHYEERNTGYTLTATATAVPPTSPVDPGELNTTVNLGSLSTPQSFTDAVGALDRNDYYKFTLDQNSQVNLGLTGLEDAAQLSIVVDLDNNGILNGSEEVETDGVGYYSNVTDDRSIVRTLPQGTYWARVYTHSDDRNTDYTLTASATALPPTSAIDPNNFNTAFNIGNLSTPQSITDAVGSLDRNDYYQFTLEQNSKVSLNLKGLTEPAHLFISVDLDNDGNYDSGEDIEVISLSDSTTSTEDRSLIRTLPKGTYWARVTTIYDSQNTGYTLDLSAIAIPPTSPVDSNGLTTAIDLGNLTTAQSFTDAVGTLDHNDYYKFTLAQNSQINLQLTGLVEPAQISLVVDLDNDGIVDSGEEIISVSSYYSITDRSLTASLPPATYWVRVYNEYDQNTSYTLTASATALPSASSVDPNELTTAINLVNLTTPQNFTDALGTLDRNDFYRLDLTQNSQISFNLSGLTQPGHLSLVADLDKDGVFDSNEEIEVDTIPDYSNSIADRSILRTLPKGLYWFRVYTQDYTQNTAYTLTAAVTAVPPTSAVDPGELNTTVNLGNLSTTQSFTDAVGALDRNDYYKFTLEQNSQVNLGLTGLTDAAQLAIVVDLDNDGMLDANEVIESDGVVYYSNSAEDRVVLRTLPKGTYWATVYTHYEDRNTGYTLTASATAVPPSSAVDPGELNTTVNLGNLNTTQSFTDAVGALDRNDYYKFTVEQNSQVNLSLTGLTDAAQLSIVVDLDNDGVLDYNEEIALDGVAYYSNGTDNRLIVRSLTKGTYWARVYTHYEDRNTGYTLTASATVVPSTNPVDPGDGIGNALNLGLLTTPKTLVDAVGSLDRSDYYRFQISQPGQINVLLSNLTDEAEIEVFADNNSNGQIDAGERLEIVNLSGTSNRNLSFTTGIGEYLVRVFNDQVNQNTGYTLTLSTLPNATVDLAGNTLGTARNLGGLLGTQTVDDAVGVGDRHDYYSFELSNSSIFNLTLANFQTSIRINLLNEQGQFIWGDYSSAIATKTLSPTALDPGKYQIWLEGFGAATDYDLSVTAIPSQDGAGNTLATARNVGILTAPQTFNDVVSEIDKNDYYRFELTADGTINLALSDETAGTNAWLYLRDSRGVVVRSNSSSLSTNLFAGTYYAHVEHGTGETAYKLSLSTTAIADHAGNNLSAAKDLGIVIGSQNLSDYVGDIDPNDFYRFELTRESALNLTLSGEASGTNAVVRLLNSSGGWIENSSTAIDRTLPAGTYYLQVAQNWGNTDYNLAIASTPIATNTPLQIQSITPDRGSNAGQASITITGTQFSPNAVVNLVDAAGNTRPATQVVWQSDRTLTASFNLTGLALGQADVTVTDQGSTAIATDVFTVNNQPQGQLEVSLSVPDAVRSWWTGEVIVNYRNTGNTDIVAPLLQLNASGAKLRLPGESEFTDSSVQFLGIHHTGFAGVLPPGASGSFSIMFQPSGNANNVNFSVSTIDPNGAIDWDPIKAKAKPDHITSAAWDAIWKNFTQSVGTTAGSYQAMLADNATALSQLGEYTGDVSQLLSFELQQVSDYQNLAQRNSIGSLGAGWAFPGDLQIVSDSQGSASLQIGGAKRQFTRLPNGNYQAVDGDDGILTRQGDIYQLRESDGTVLTFRSNGRLDKIQDPNSNQITAVYGGDRLTRLDRSNGDSLSFSYNTQGRISTMTDEVGRTTTYGYDATGEKLLSTTDVSGTLNYTYDSNNAIKSITYPDGTKASFDYDSQGRLIHQSLNNGAESLTYTYDSTGGITITDGTNAQTKLWLNDRGQIGQMQDAQGRIVQLRYDDQGNLTRIVAPENTITGFSYDAEGNLTSQTNALGQRIEFAYEPNFDQLQQVRDAKGNLLKFAYDDRGNLTGIAYADGSQETYSYDAQGNVTVAVNRRNQTIQYTYDNKGQLLRKDYSDGTSATYTYDSRGNLKSATDADSSVTYDYDNADRLTKVTYGNGRFVQFTYDVGGRRTRMVDQDGFVVNYRYDSAGRLAELTDSGNQRIVLYTYDAVGRLSREDNGNGTYTTYSYDSAGQLLSLVNHKANNTVNSRFDYTYDALGRRTSATTLEGKTTYSYDATGQLARVSLPGGRTIQYQYDAAGNRISVTDSGTTKNYNTNNLNQYTAVGTANYTYDKDGNLIAKTENGITTNYSYDAENRLIGVARPNEVWTYEYDATGNRIATIFNGQRTEYLLDPIGLGDVVGEYNSNTLVARYTHGLGLVSRADATNAMSYYDADAIGSTTGITDATGTYLNQYRYLPFGESLSETETIANPFEYVGQWGVMDEDNGLQFVRARYYSSLEGRFMNTDPIGILGGLNLYAYVQNDPVNYVDLFGEARIGKVLQTIKEINHRRGNHERFRGGHGKDNLDDFSARWISGKTGDIKDIGGYTGKGATGKSFEKHGDGKGYEYHKHESSEHWTHYTREKGFADIDILLFPWKIAGAFAAGYGVGTLINEYLLPDSWKEAIGNFIGPIFDSIGDAFTRILTSFDPNDIIGPAGVGTEGWMLPGQVMPYMIRFENLATATAPAVFVTVTQQLDADLNWSTFELGDFGFRNFNIDVPAGLQSYNTRINTNDGYFVDFAANLNTTNGQVKWELKMVDASGKLPTDPLAGFLPPNNANREGEGFVNYHIKPKTNLGNSASLTAEATIVFDTNEPINTPVWLNRLDLNKPTSTVNALPGTTTGNAIALSWSGSDDGSGVATYDIYVSLNGAPPTLWLDNTSTTTATYTGEIGNTYAFYSVATDSTGYVEELPTNSDTQTILVAPAPQSPVTPPVTSVPGITKIGTKRKDRLTGQAGDDILIGKGGNDQLIGDAGDDRITGDAGKDTLTGGLGKDGFYFNRPTEGSDRITDFSVIDDTIFISAKRFRGGFKAGKSLTKDQFQIGSRAKDRSDRFIYNPLTGGLFFDADGIGNANPIQLAQLTKKLKMTTADIVVVP